MDPLADVGELENHLQRNLDDATAATLALQLASGAVRAFCGWDLARETTTFESEGNGGVVLTLPTLNLIDVTAVRIDGWFQDLDLPATDPTRVVWWRKGQLYRWAGWPRQARIEVDAVHGYDPVPDLVKLVTLDMAAKQLSNPEGLASATVGQVSRTWTSSGTAGSSPMSALHQRLLERYSLIGV